MHGQDIADLEYTLADSEWTIAGKQAGTFGADIAIQGAIRPRRDRGIERAAFSGGFNGVFQVPMNAPPLPGLYLNAQRVDANSTTNPWMQFGGFGLGCGDLVGAFEIHELVFGAPDPSNGFPVIEKLAVDFLQHCATLELTPAITGSIGSTAPFPCTTGSIRRCRHRCPPRST